MARLVRPLTTVLVLILLVAGALVVRRRGGSDGVRLTAHFSRTVGLYPGSSVRVLGVKIGTVRKITPQGRSVEVVMRVSGATKIPADARAVIIPPSLVSDRYVQLTPVYTGGAVLVDGADIPLARTRTPAELDEILASLDRLLVALGPQGANADGSLSKLVSVGAKTLGGGNGKRLNASIVGLAQAITTLAEGRDDLAGVLTNLSAFTETLALNDSKVRALMSDLATVSEQLSDERESLELALKNLAVALGEVGSLVKDHRATLGADIDSLAKVTQTVLAQKQSLIEALDTTPLLLANIAETVNLEGDTLDIRNNAGQQNDPYGIFVCQVLAPLLGIDCPPDPTAGAAPGGRGTAVRAPAAARGTEPALAPFTIAGMLGATP